MTLKSNNIQFREDVKVLLLEVFRNIIVFPKRANSSYDAVYMFGSVPGFACICIQLSTCRHACVTES